jgi:hypothetical protein
MIFECLDCAKIPCADFVYFFIEYRAVFFQRLISDGGNAKRHIVEEAKASNEGEVRHQPRSLGMAIEVHWKSITMLSECLELQPPLDGKRHDAQVLALGTPTAQPLVARGTAVFLD